MNRDSIFQAIIEERERQERLHPLPFARRIDSADMKAISTIIIYGDIVLCSGAIDAAQFTKRMA